MDFVSYLQHTSRTAKYAPMGELVYCNRNDDCRCAECSRNSALQNSQKQYYDAVGKHQDFLEDTQYLICPPRVLGYWLSGRCWVELDISENTADPGMDHLRRIPELRSTTAFEHLELLPRQKRLIQSLVETHGSGNGRKPIMEDLMKGKGKGLVILLHGNMF